MVSIDKLTTLVDGAQLNTGSAGATYNLGSIDLGVPTGDPFAGTPTYLVIAMETAATGGNGAVCQFRLVTGTSGTPATNTGEVLLETAAFSLTDMGEGKVLFCAPVPQGTDAVPILQHLAIQTVITGAAFTADAGASKVNAFLTDQPYKHEAYPQGAPTPPATA